MQVHRLREKEGGVETRDRWTVDRQRHTHTHTQRERER